MCACVRVCARVHLGWDRRGRLQRAEGCAGMRVSVVWVCALGMETQPLDQVSEGLGLGLGLGVQTGQF